MKLTKICLVTTVSLTLAACKQRRSCHRITRACLQHGASVQMDDAPEESFANGNSCCVTAKLYPT